MLIFAFVVPQIQFWSVVIGWWGGIRRAGFLHWFFSMPDGWVLGKSGSIRQRLGTGIGASARKKAV